MFSTNRTPEKPTANTPSVPPPQPDEPRLLDTAGHVAVQRAAQVQRDIYCMTNGTPPMKTQPPEKRPFSACVSA
jgi:hypothetical protein